MITETAPHPCGGGAKVFPRNCRLRVFFYLKKGCFLGKGKTSFPEKKPNVGTEVSLPPRPHPFSKKARYGCSSLSQQDLLR